MIKALRFFMLTIITAVLTFSFGMGTYAKERTPDTSYRSVTEIHDWGAAIKKLIIEVGKPLPRNSVAADTFDVHVKEVMKD